MLNTVIPSWVSHLCLFMNIFTTWCGWGCCGLVRFMGKHSVPFSSKTPLSHTHKSMKYCRPYENDPQKRTDSQRNMGTSGGLTDMIINVNRLWLKLGRNDSFCHINKILIKLKTVQMCIQYNEFSGSWSKIFFTNLFLKCSHTKVFKDILLCNSKMFTKKLYMHTCIYNTITLVIYNT